MAYIDDMRPIYHPPMSEVTVQGLLHALSDPIRVHIFSDLLRADLAVSCTNAMGKLGVELPKSSLSQHFKILRESGLIRSERKGVELQNTTRWAELEVPYGRMIKEIIAAYSSGCHNRLKQQMPGPAV
jgi:DNA-binding transcriptional ArsR family regulator